MAGALPFAQSQGHGMVQWISNVLQQFPGGGKEMRLHFCNLKMSYLPQALPLPLPGLTFIFFLFSLFFSHFILFVIILITPEYIISNTARRPIDMVDQTNPISIHNQENFVPSFDMCCPFAAFQVQNH